MQPRAYSTYSYCVRILYLNGRTGICSTRLILRAAANALCRLLLMSKSRRLHRRMDWMPSIVSVRCVGCSSGRWHPSLLSPSSVATEVIIELQPRCCHVQTRKGCASDMRCAYGVAAAIGGPHFDGRALSVQEETGTLELKWMGVLGGL